VGMTSVGRCGLFVEIFCTLVTVSYNTNEICIATAHSVLIAIYQVNVCYPVHLGILLPIVALEYLQK